MSEQKPIEKIREQALQRMHAGRPPKPASERFWPKVDISGGPDACWPWMAFRNPKGYGQFSPSPQQRHINAHRAAWQIVNGPVADGLHVDHLCRNRACVNPRHLQAIPCRENVLAPTSQSLSAINSRKTHCHRGHKFDSANTYLHRGKRSCKAYWVLRRKALSEVAGGGK